MVPYTQISHIFFTKFTEDELAILEVAEIKTPVNLHDSPVIDQFWFGLDIVILHNS